MIAPATFLSFLITCVIIEATPGPNMGYLALLSASKGRRAGFAATAGVALGLMVVGIIAALGLTVIISESPILYQLLRWSGILYLLYLAWDSWRESSEDPNAPSIHHSHYDFFKRGLIVNLLNPKAAVFYVTILPTFIDPMGAVARQGFTLTFLYVGIATLIHGLIVSLSGSWQGYLQTPSRRKTAGRFFAVLLAVIALWFGYDTM
jgi:threonine/homoserine/homoserine lactone efflux protein